MADQMTPEMKIYKSALWYARHGFKVFPLQGKVPLSKSHGPYDATDDVQQIARWWANGQAKYNIGLATGVLNGIIALDVDVHPEEGIRDDELLEELEEMHGPLPETWMALSGNGGVHYFFKSNDPDITLDSDFVEIYDDAGNVIQKGLDYRGNGGYIVLTPSIHPETGRSYEWDAAHRPEDTPLAPLPEWLRDYMLASQRKKDKGKSPEKVPERMEQGSRNTLLFKSACSLRGRGYTEDEILATMMTVNQNRCDPPLPEREVETIVKSASKYERGVLPGEAEREPERTERKKPKLIAASSVPYTPPRWLLAPYFQIGKGTLIQADPGTGKTAFMCAIAAHVTTGMPLLNQEVSEPGNVVMISVEDEPGVLRGRIEADGGDVDRVFFPDDPEELTFSSPEIEEFITEANAKLLIFDPFQHFLGARVDMHRANETRPILAKLFEVCNRHSCSCAIVAHLGKNQLGKSPVNGALGSVDIGAAMRSIIHLGINPDDENEVVAVHIKSNNAPKGRSIAYTIGDRGGVHWSGYSNIGIGDLTTAQKRKDTGINYENEPLVKVFNHLITDHPEGMFITYGALKSEGSKILGFPPFIDLTDLRNKLDNGLARELQRKDGLIVTHGQADRKNRRGVKIERFILPQGYQMHLDTE